MHNCSMNYRTLSFNWLMDITILDVGDGVCVNCVCVNLTGSIACGCSWGEEWLSWTIIPIHVWECLMGQISGEKAWKMRCNRDSKKLLRLCNRYQAERGLQPFDRYECMVSSSIPCSPHGLIIHSAWEKLLNIMSNLTPTVMATKKLAKCRSVIVLK